MVRTVRSCSVFTFNRVRMSMYAQTNVQLFNQLQRDGYRGPQLRLIADAYYLAARLFAARIEPTGKCFMAHVIGTASILGANAAPAELVAAGLVHNVYRNGDFGDYRRKVTAARRERIRRVTGETAEDYVYRFATRRWNVAGLRETHEQLSGMQETDRHVLQLYLADQLEKLQGLELLYRKNHEERCGYYREYGPLLVDMGHRLGCPRLAQELQAALQVNLESTIPDELRSTDEHRYSFLCIPRSCRSKRMIPALLAVPRGIKRLFRKKPLRQVDRPAMRG